MIETAFTFEPRAVAEPTTTVPASTLTPPLKVLLPDIVTTPVPDLLSELEPEMLAETRTASEESISRAEAASVPVPELMTWPAKTWMTLATELP